MKKVALIWLLLCSVCYGEIVAPNNVDVGKKLVVSSNDDAEGYIWTIPDGIDYQAVDNNKTLYCWGLEGKYVFVLTTFKIDWEKHTFIQTPQQRHVVVIGKSEPPNPPKPPEPDLTGFAKEVYDWGAAVDPKYRVSSISLSNNYSSVAKKLEDKDVTIAEALDQIREGNNKILDTQDKKDAWAVFGSRLQGAMEKAWPMDGVVFVKFLNDVALGLSKVK